MENLRICIDVNDKTITENKISEIVDTWKFFSKPPFTIMYINEVDAGWGTKEWCLRAPLPAGFGSKQTDSYWESVGEEIINCFDKPTKVCIYLEREIVFLKKSPKFDDWYGINLTATVVKDNTTYDFSGDDLSADPRFW